MSSGGWVPRARVPDRREPSGTRELSDGDHQFLPPAEKAVPGTDGFEAPGEPVPARVPGGSQAELSLGDGAELVGTDDHGLGTGSPPFRGNREPWARTRAEDLLKRVQELGIDLRVKDGQILARPIGLVSPELRTELAAQRAGLIVLLGGTVECNLGRAGQGEPCPICGNAHGKLEPPPACDACGATDLVVMVVGIDGGRYCRRCRRNGGPQWE